MSSLQDQNNRFDSGAGGLGQDRAQDGQGARHVAVKKLLNHFAGVLIALGNRFATEASTKRPRRLLRLSGLTQRIVAINLVVLVFLMLGVLYFNRSRENLIDAHQQALGVQARTIAEALAGTAIVEIDGNAFLDRELVIPVMRRLIDPSQTHARLYSDRRRLLADSHLINDIIVQRELAPLGSGESRWNPFRDMYYLFTEYLASGAYYPEAFVSNEADSIRASVEAGLSGNQKYTVRRNEAGELVVGLAVPIQQVKKVVGVLILEVSDIDRAIEAERKNILTIFAIAIVVSLMSSFWLAQAIAKPVRRLAEAADMVRLGASGRKEIPILSGRRDEIGDLSESLGAMTNALYDRIDAIESFAADVAHEIKNPLTSLRSAVETFQLAKTQDIQLRLIAVIKDDVMRIDRLISDISNASRLDAELARSQTEPLDLRVLLQGIADIYEATQKDGEAKVIFKEDANDSGNAHALIIAGLESSLAQVFRNLVDNARSFSPPGGVVTLRAYRDKNKKRRQIVVTVEDQGPGIPDDSLESIFERFYTSRPDAADFGKHSGLGLAISRQIAEAHRGTLRAENIRPVSDDGTKGPVTGARFIVSLPALKAR